MPESKEALHTHTHTGHVKEAEDPTERATNGQSRTIWAKK